ncbi:MAG: hhoB [Clostridia bacterium]|jgi:S1-C subfamily serine protease|nr:hhoB [Clostridia bacterium]
MLYLCIYQIIQNKEEFLVQKNKPLAFAFLICFLIIGIINCPSVNAASKKIAIYVDDKALVSSAPPIMEKGVTLVPMRLIFEALGAQVVWSPETQMIIAKKNDVNITLTIGKTISFINMNKQVLSLPPQIKNGTAYVPLRFIGESLGAKVEWNEKSQNILIHSNSEGKSLSTYDNKASASQKELSIQEVGKLENTIAFIYNNGLDGSESFGSGFAISKDGIVVTNYHVIANAKKLTISFNESKDYTDISILGFDALKDIAVLKINTNDTFPFCKLGDSSKAVLGDSIVVIGNPMGLRNTLSTGIISSLKQQDYIQITAPISPGSSGGALFNMFGEVIGIASAGILEGENLGFCIPINELKKVSLGTPLTLAELHGSKTSLSAPQNVKAFALSSSEIVVQWDYNKDIDYYHVYFSDSPNGNFEPFLNDNNTIMAFPWEDTYSMSHYDLSPVTTVYYKVTGVLNGIESSFSKIVSATTFEDDSDAFINIVKQGNFDAFLGQAIGSHFNSFFDNPKWTYFRSTEQENVVEFTGACSYKNKDVTILIQFIVNPLNDSFKVIYMERDGAAMPSLEFNHLLNTIFTN